MGSLVNSTKNLRNNTNSIHSSEKLKSTFQLIVKPALPWYPNKTKCKKLYKKRMSQINIMKRLVRCCYYHHCSLFFRSANRIEGCGVVCVKGDLWPKLHRCTFSRLYLELSGKWICCYGLATTAASRTPGSKGQDSEERDHSEAITPWAQESWWPRFYLGTTTFPQAHVALVMLRAWDLGKPDVSKYAQKHRGNLQEWWWKPAQERPAV